MATDDDNDILTGAVPEPDAPASSSERTHAKTFADLVDKSLTGRSTPPAMSADDRALLEVATVIRAASGNIELSAAKRRSIVEDALHQAVGGAGSAKAGSVTPIARGRTRRWAPWAIATASTVVAAAAILLLWLRGPTKIVTAPPGRPVAEIPTSWKSRPADRLIGPIKQEHAGDASDRIDAIFANRLDGYRDRSLTMRGRKAP